MTVAEWNPHRPEIAGGYDIAQCLILRRVGAGAPFDGERPQRQAVNVEGHGGRDRRGFDVRQRGEAGDKRRRKDARLRRVRIPGCQVVRGEEHAVAAEAGIRFPRLTKAAQEQSSRREDDQRQRDLRPHENIARSATARGLNTGAQGDLRIDARELDGRGQSEDESRGQTKKNGERETLAVDARLKLDRKRADHWHRAQRLRSPDGDTRAKECARRRQR